MPTATRLLVMLSAHTPAAQASRLVSFALLGLLPVLVMCGLLWRLLLSFSTTVPSRPGRIRLL